MKIPIKLSFVVGLSSQSEQAYEFLLIFERNLASLVGGEIPYKVVYEQGNKPVLTATIEFRPDLSALTTQEVALRVLRVLRRLGRSSLRTFEVPSQIGPIICGEREFTPIGFSIGLALAFAESMESSDWNLVGDLML